MKRSTKLLYMILALLVSILLWVYVVGVERPEKEEVFTDIPVTFVGEQELRDDYSLIITSNRRPTVSLTVRGSILDIAALNANKDAITVKASLTAVGSTGLKIITYDVSLPRNINVTLVDQSPYYLEVVFDRVYTNAVEVQFKNEGTLAEDYLLKTPEINPASLQLTGPKSLVEQVEYAEVVWTRQNLNQTLTLDIDYTLYDAEGNEISDDGISANYDVISVTLPVQKTRVVPLTVDIQAGGGATEADIEMSISQEYITIAGEPSVIDAINSVSVAIIRLSEVYGAGGTRTYSILLPDGVENLSGVTECDVTINIINLKLTAFTCENITLINKPENITVTLITQKLACTLRGKQEELQAITANNLRVVADLDGVDLSGGRKSVPATVYIDGTSSVGVVGTYSIAIEVTP